MKLTRKEEREKCNDTTLRKHMLVGFFNPLDSSGGVVEFDRVSLLKSVNSETMALTRTNKA